MNMLVMREARGGWLGVHNVYMEHALDLGLTGLGIFLRRYGPAYGSSRTSSTHSIVAGSGVLAQGLQVSLLAWA